MKFFKHIQKGVLPIICILFAQLGIAQFTNKEVVAKLEIEQLDDILNVEAKASNTTDVYKSLSYSLAVIRTNKQTQNLSRNAQEGRFTLEPNETKKVATTAINSQEEDKIVVLLLVYDEDRNIIGKDRFAINEEKKEDAQTDAQKENIPNDGIEIKGIVIDETKTKPGRDFYESFYSKYTLNKINGEKVVTIIEKFSLARSTIMEVKIDDNLIAQFITRPDYEYIEQMSTQSIRLVYKYFQDLKKQRSYITQY